MDLARVPAAPAMTNHRSLGACRSVRTPARHAHWAAARSSAQRRDHGTQQWQLRFVSYVKARAIRQTDLNAGCVGFVRHSPADRRWRSLLRRCHQSDRHKLGRSVGAKPTLAHLSTPTEQQTRIDLMARRDFRHSGTLLLRLGHYPQLLLSAPTPPPLLARDDL